MKIPLLALVILSIAAPIFAKDHPSLDFFIIYEKPFKDAEAVSIFQLNLKGYRSPFPDLQITRLKSAVLNSQVGHSIMKNVDGTIKNDWQMDYKVTVVLEDQDDQKLTAFSEKAKGQRVLLQIDSTPLIAPILHSRLRKIFEISSNDNKKAGDILARLLPLVEEEKTEQGAAAKP